MEIGDWIMLTLIILAILVVSGYLQKQNPAAYSVVDNTWTKITTGAYDVFSNLVSQVKTPKASTNSTTGGG